jgi:hypothetical protein
MARHPLRDDLVILDDQNLRHAVPIIGCVSVCGG